MLLFWLLFDIFAILKQLTNWSTSNTNLNFIVLFRFIDIMVGSLSFSFRRNHLETMVETKIILKTTFKFVLNNNVAYMNTWRLFYECIQWLCKYREIVYISPSILSDTIANRFNCQISSTRTNVTFIFIISAYIMSFS